MRARIFRPHKSASSSGYGRTGGWVLEYPPEGRDLEPLMGWVSGADTQSQVSLSFETKEQAIAYAKERGIDAVVQEHHDRRPNIRPGGYGENFSTSRRMPWTH
jgi:NADH dehydrogenase